MKFTVLSDIHANAAALELALAAIKNSPYHERILCLGDVVGFHTEPGRCIDLIRENNIQCISGNHDAGVVGKLPQHKFPWECWEAIEWTRKRLNTDQMRFLESLQTDRLERPLFWMMHGMIGDVHHYMNSNWKVHYTTLRMKFAQTKFGFFGHTHAETCYQVPTPGLSKVRGLEASGTVSLNRSSSYLINPGTIGQPRRKDENVRFLFVDLEAGGLQFQEIPYDYSAVVKQTLSVFPRHVSMYERFGSL